jgi:hypothetical protein
MEQLISFNNGVASVKEGFIIDESKLRATTVYAKLMLNKGTKHADKSFMKSASGAFIKAEAFVIGSKGQIVFDNKLFLSIDPTKSKLLTNGSMWFVELEHPSIDVSKCESVEW